MSKNSYGVIVQARCGSSRLPGKVMGDICGKPMLQRQLERLRWGIQMDKLVVATSTHSDDDPIETMCRENQLTCFRGPLNDVMRRFVECAKTHGIDHIVRVGGDDPLIDWECCNALVKRHSKNPSDFLYASHREGWPYGAAAELIRRDALEKIHAKTDAALYREHTIPYFFDHPGDFRIEKLAAPPAVHRPDYFFSVDYREDFALVQKIFTKLIDRFGEFFEFERVIELLDQTPDLLEGNQHLHDGFGR